MLEFLTKNKTMLLIFALWFGVGSVSPLVFYLFGTLTIILLWRRQMYFEILLGFIFVLILSDNLSQGTDFAKDYKNAYIVLLAAIPIFDRRTLGPTNRIFSYFLPFILVALVGIIFSPAIFTGFQKTLSYILLLYAVPQFFLKSFEDKGPQMVKDIIFFCVAMIVLGYMLRFIDPGISTSHGGRFRAMFGNPNGLGIFCILLFAFATLAREYFKGLISKTDMRWIFIPIALAILLSGSRTAIIALVLFFTFTRFYRISPFLGFLAFVGFGFAAELLSSNLVAIVQSLGLSDFFRIETLEGGSGRYIAWTFAWEIIQNHFWFGRGFAFDEWLMTSNQDLLNDLGHQGGVHNTYLIIWLNTGLVGLLLFLRAFLLLFIKGAKNTRLAFPVLWMVLFSIMLEPWLAASLNPFTILLVMSLIMITEPLFQPYIRDELGSFQKPDEAPAFA